MCDTIGAAGSLWIEEITLGVRTAVLPQCWGMGRPVWGVCGDEGRMYTLCRWRQGDRSRSYFYLLRCSPFVCATVGRHTRVPPFQKWNPPTSCYSLRSRASRSPPCPLSRMSVLKDIGRGPIDWWSEREPMDLEHTVGGGASVPMSYRYFPFAVGTLKRVSVDMI
ncbi:hypothetical protein BC939DRAFT_149815 [Gamsiella multidivaricata]|uniref:uncharacterized protein n=1 Tax=Gamsiella multidivaricata TaxID=101098 RepID=UPI00222023DF|nr:uncharacterized protein BC939DRAFT_149815 [Gamsiella multidivaricata]KAI7831771.1 hypothetical protein BC939DRAFT_149815 [Gamsiella multidivaricata]